MSTEQRKQAPDAERHYLTLSEVRENPWLVIEGIYAGIPISRMLKKGDVCACFFQQHEENEALGRAYERAQLALAEVRADECVAIADEEADPQVARVRIDARRWWASKVKPKKYGERIDAHVTIELPDLARAIEEGRNRAAVVVAAQAAKAVAATLVLPHETDEERDPFAEPMRERSASDVESVAARVALPDAEDVLS